jgi:hypothetical protein
VKDPRDEPGYRADVVIIPHGAVSKAWPEIEPYISRALSHSLGELSLADLQEICENGLGALLAFLTPNGTLVGGAVTQILDHPDGRRVCRILAYGADDWNATKHCLSQVEVAAARAGAQAMHFNGRPGWVKLCEPMGYKPMQVIMEKPLVAAEGNV